MAARPLSAGSFTDVHTLGNAQAGGEQYSHSSTTDARAADAYLLAPDPQGHARALRQNPALVFGADAVAANLQSTAPAAATAGFDPAAAAAAARGTAAQRGADLDAKEAMMVFEKQRQEAGSGGMLGKVAELEAALERIIRDSWKKEGGGAAKSEPPSLAPPCPAGPARWSGRGGRRASPTGRLPPWAGPPLC
jgi:hypothetical protein